ILQPPDALFLFAFVVHWRSVSERGVPGHLSFRLRSEATTAEQLALERRKETLRHCVVIRIPRRAHRQHDPRFLPAALNDFHQATFRKKIYGTLEELQDGS